MTGQHHPGQSSQSGPQNQAPWWNDPQQPGNGYGTATPPPGYQQPPPGYGYPAPQQPYPSGPGHQAPRPPRKRHTIRNVILGAMGGIVLIIIIAAVANSSNNGVQKTSSPPTANAATSAPPSPNPGPSSNNTTGPVGTTFAVTETNDSGATVKYSVTLDKVLQHAAADNSFDTAPAGEHLAGAEFTIKGLVGDDQDDANNDASAIGNDSQTYQPGFETLAAGTNFSNGNFNTDPGSVSIGWVTFEVKDGIHIASIQWSPGSGMSGTAPATWTVDR